LTQAREAAGLRKADLANLMGVTDALIGMYESGKRSPTPDTLNAISLHCKQPIGFFSKPPPPTRSGVVFYRSNASALALDRISAQAKMTMLWDMVDYFQALIVMPPVNMPKIGALPSDPAKITDHMIESAAMTARQHWNLGTDPCPNIVWLLEGSGAVVVRIDLATEKMEALSEIRPEDGRPYIILNTTKRNAFRSRADIAHELGHLLLHAGVGEHHMADKETFKTIEAQAWKFAQAFLLPEQSFMRDVYSISLDALRTLKPKWKVSIAFMIQRLYKLDILTEDKFVNARKNLGQRGWLRTEPFDLETEPERPLLMRQLVEFIIDQKLLTRDQVVGARDYYASFLEELLQVERGYFKDGKPDFQINLKFTPRSSTG